MVAVCSCQAPGSQRMSADAFKCPRCGASIAEVEPAAACPRCGLATEGVKTTPGGPEDTSTARRTERRFNWRIVPLAAITLAAVALAVISLRSALKERDEPGATVDGRTASSRPPAAGTSGVTFAGAAVGGGQAIRPVQAMVGRFHVFQASAADKQPVMVALPALWTDAPPEILGGPHFGTLARLIMEQAILGAARDDMGMATRAMALGDAAPAGAADLFVEVITPYQSGGSVHFTIRRGGEAGDILAESSSTWAATDPRAYARFIPEAEAKARAPFLE